MNLVAGRGVPQDDKEADSFFSKLLHQLYIKFNDLLFIDLACQSNHLVACYHLGALRYLSAKEDKKTEDTQSAINILEKTCTAGNNDSCFFVGEHYIQPNASHRSPQKAVEYLKLACDANHTRSCYNLAVLFKKGDDGITPNNEQFIYYKERTQDLAKQFGSVEGRRTG